MTGDQTDMFSRVKSLLPRGWFVGSTPVLDALLSGFAWSLSLIYSLIQYAKFQTRIATATDGFLDLISFDFFGNNLLRKTQEMDSAFRARILDTLLREKVTRNGMIKALVNLTGRTPIIFEPARPADTGAYGVSTSGYGVAGRYGSLLYPAQVFIKAYRSSSSGIPFIAGYGTSASGYGVPGQAKYCSLADIQGAATDADIYQTIAATLAEGVIAWTQLSD